MPVIQITNKGDDIYSIELHPLTGRGRIYPFAYQPIDDLDSESEVRDPT